MSNEPQEVGETEAQRVLHERIDAAVAAGAAHLPFPEPEPPREPRTYDPKNVRVTFNGVELQGFVDGTFIVGHDPGAKDLSAVNTWKVADDARGTVRYWNLSPLLAEHAKYARRHFLRARMRARKRRRGW